MVGGAIIQLIKGSRTVTAGGPATIIGAYHKMQGATSVTFKAGISEVVIDGSGVSISTLLLMMGGSTIQLAQDVADA
jgi:type VI secretion system secreted protein VgrG